MATVVVAQHEGYWRLGLHRPPVNALDNDVVGDLIDAARAARDDPSCRALLIASDLPGIFCAGADIKFLDAGAQDDLRRLRVAVHECFTLIEQLALPVVAAVDGPALGGGLELLLACDLLVAADRPAVRLGVPEITLGFLPGSGGTQRLPRRAIGRARATQMIMTGAPVGARQAWEMGLVAELVDAPSAEPRAAELAASLGAGPTAALGAVKRCVAAATSAGLAEGLEVERRQLAHVLASDDAREGVRAFVERRSARFTGR